MYCFNGNINWVIDEVGAEADCKFKFDVGQ